MTLNQTVEAREERISLEGMSIEYAQGPNTKTVLTDATMKVSAGEFVCLVGASGSGKSTVLNALAGFVKPSKGKAVFDGSSISSPDSNRGVVFQEQSLFPWKTALENVEFGLKMHGMRREQRRERGQELLDMVGLGEEAGRYPKQLSGGMRQRVAIARTLAPQPEVLLMDEPFGALDAQTRSQLQQLITRIWQDLDTTVVFVTHDIDEALFLADRVVVIGGKPSTILQEFPVNADRPRTLEFSSHAETVSLKRDILGLLSGEVAA